MNIEIGAFVMMLAFLSLGLFGVILMNLQEIKSLRGTLAFYDKEHADFEFRIKGFSTFPLAAKIDLERRALRLKELEMRVIAAQQRMSRPSGRRYLPYLENAQQLAHLQAEHEEAKKLFEAAHADFREFRNIAATLWGNKVWYGFSWKDCLPEETASA